MGPTSKGREGEKTGGKVCEEEKRGQRKRGDKRAGREIN